MFYKQALHVFPIFVHNLGKTFFFFFFFFKFQLYILCSYKFQSQDAD